MEQEITTALRNATLKRDTTALQQAVILPTSVVFISHNVSLCFGLMLCRLVGWQVSAARQHGLKTETAMGQEQLARMVSSPYMYLIAFA